jgi:hypothetical protein
MKFLPYFIFAAIIPSNYFALIQNQYKPICANCKFFISNKNKCRKFGEMDLVTGEYTYSNAITIRNNKDKCGENAIEFEKDDFKVIKNSYYFLTENWALFTLFSLYSVLLLATITNSKS